MELAQKGGESAKYSHITFLYSLQLITRRRKAAGSINQKGRLVSFSLKIAIVRRFKLQGEVDNMEDIIGQRKKDINQIESIMSNLNAIAKDIAMETQKQGEKVKRLDEHMTVAADNTKAGLGEL